MKKYTDPMMDYCEFFESEEEAIAACREVNRRLNSKDPACCVVVDGPEDNYAVVDLETAKNLLDFGEESQLPCLIVTDLSGASTPEGCFCFNRGNTSPIWAY